MHRHLLRCFAALAVAGVPGVAAAVGKLEIPAQHSSQSGIGLISGWHCSAARIEISIDLGPPILVSSHTPREDTQPVCGRSDTGFAMPFNWNILQKTFPGIEIGTLVSHRVIAFADGVKFADVTFQTTNMDTEFLTGKSGVYVLRNFPHGGNNRRIAWDEERQNFSMTSDLSNYGVYSPTSELGGSGTYYGALTVSGTNICTTPFTQGPAQTRYGKFTVTTNNGQMQFRAEYADGGACQSPVVPVSPDRPLIDGRVKGQFSAAALASCPEFGGAGLLVTANGKNLDADAVGGCNAARLTGARPETQ